MRPGMAAGHHRPHGTRQAAENALGTSRADARSRDRAPGEAHTTNSHERAEGGVPGGTLRFPWAYSA